jgi:hypothetical protein
MDTRARTRYAASWAIEGISGAKTVTEAEWLKCTDAAAMLHYLQGKTSDRKLRLFAVACCRRIRHILRGKRLRRAVKVAERHAERKATASEMASAAWALRERSDPPANAARWSATVRADEAASQAIEWVTITVAVARGEDDSPGQAELLRCIFGNPFRPITCNPSWLTWHDGLLVSIAQQMYESRDFTDMPILADALEEAGCTDTSILGHLRGPGPHVRGCWVIDLLIGKK